MRLTDLLEQHRPVGPEESAHYEATMALASRGAQAFDSQHFEPGHVTGSVFVVCRTTQRALLIFHRRLGRWLQPGGHAEPGETDIRITAARELREETGIAIEPDALSLLDVDVHVIPATATAPAHNHYDVRFLAWVANEDGHADSDAARLRWYSVEELLVPEIEPSIHRLTRKALGKEQT